MEFIKSLFVSGNTDTVSNKPNTVFMKKIKEQTKEAYDRKALEFHKNVDLCAAEYQQCLLEDIETASNNGDNFIHNNKCYGQTFVSNNFCRNVMSDQERYSSKNPNYILEIGHKRLVNNDFKIEKDHWFPCPNTFKIRW